jgi:3-methyladenine DNA glycosylase AlkD
VETEDIPGGVKEIAAAIDAEIRALSFRDTPALRAIRRKYSWALNSTKPEFVFRLAGILCKDEDRRWFAFELLANHRAAFACLDGAAVESFGKGINSWGSVDSFARILSGPAWLRGQIRDGTILRWARSEDRWWRRAALVSTVALNSRSQGGTGDVSRTLRLCRLLANDPDDMVAKDLSWALRALAVHDASAVRGFLSDYDGMLAARAKREVKNKLATGLKNPRRPSLRKPPEF